MHQAGRDPRAAVTLAGRAADARARPRDRRGDQGQAEARPGAPSCSRACTSGWGRSRRASSHYKGFHALREEVEREDSARKLADAKLIFEAEQTRKENAVIRAQKAEIERKNVELQDTIDELTRARIGRKAKAFTLGVAIVLFIFQDAILRTVLRLLPSDNYFLLLVVKMAIIFSLAPINRGIENYLLRRVVRKGLPRVVAAGG